MTYALRSRLYITEGCICCANGNDLPEGEYCRACLRGADEILLRLEGAELDAFLREIGMDPEELLESFKRTMGTPRVSSEDL